MQACPPIARARARCPAPTVEDMAAGNASRERTHSPPNKTAPHLFLHRLYIVVIIMSIFFDIFVGPVFDLAGTVSARGTPRVHTTDGSYSL